MNHTKEPWRVVSDSPVMAIYSEPEDYRIVQTVNQNNFDNYGKSRVDVGIYKQEDAERIVACVNACAGVDDENLRTGYVKELEKENERLKGIVHNLDHRLITNGEWSKV